MRSARAHLHAYTAVAACTSPSWGWLTTGASSPRLPPLPPHAPVAVPAVAVPSAPEPKPLADSDFMPQLGASQSFSVNSLSSMLEPGAVPEYKPRASIDMPKPQPPSPTPPTTPGKQQSPPAKPPQTEIRASGPGPKEKAWVASNVQPGLQGAWAEARKKEAEAAEKRSQWIKEQMELKKQKEAEEKKREQN